MSKHGFLKVRIPIEPHNPAICLDEYKCIKCGMCRKICREDMAVGKMYDLEKTGDQAICVHCGQCANVCPVGAIKEVPEYEEVRREIKDSGKVVVFSVSPATCASFGEAFGLEPSKAVKGHLISALRRLGADYVFDTALGTDLMVMEETAELVRRVRKQEALPQFTSFCPAWVELIEIFYPKLIPCLSTVKNAISIQGLTVKTYFAKEKHITPERMVHVVLTPCTAEKFAAKRPEMLASGEYYGKGDMQDVDYVLTTNELVDWMKQEKMMFASLSEENYDPDMGGGSGASVITRNAGGLTEAVLRSLFPYLTQEETPEDLLELEPFRGLDAVKEAEIDINDMTFRLAMVHGLQNAKALLERIIKKEVYYDFVEVMACRGGCIGGGGQPKLTAVGGDTLRLKRLNDLYRQDAKMKVRCSYQNQQVQDIYQKFYGEPGSGRARNMLHTGYVSREDLLTAGQKEMGD